MANNITVLVDIDDTIEYLSKAWVETLNNEYGTDVDYEKIRSWDISAYFPSLTEEQVFRPLHQDRFWTRVEPMSDAIKYLQWMIFDGFDVYLCTTTDYRNVKAKYESIVKKHFPFISWDKVIITSSKQMIKADILIDDGEHNLEGGDYLKILFTAPHNKNCNAKKHGFIRADSWSEVYKIVLHYERLKEVCSTLYGDVIFDGMSEMQDTEKETTGKKYFLRRKQFGRRNVRNWTKRGSGTKG